MSRRIRADLSQQSRYQSLEMEPMDDSTDNSNHTWMHENLDSMQLKRSEMNELVMDYLVHEGFKEAAERFREEAGIDLSNFGYSDMCSSGVSRTNPTNNINNGVSAASAAAAATTFNNTTTTTSTTTTTTKRPASGNRRDQSDCKNDTSSDSIEDMDGATDSTVTTVAASASVGAGSSSSSQNTTNLDNNNADQMIVNGHSNGTDWLTRIETADMMDKRVEIRHHIEEGDILKAKSLINLYYPELLDNHRDLYFKLQQQHLIELIRQQKINDVLTYVHEQLSVDELGDLTEMERTLALLAYENPDKSPYANLLQASHRLQLASEINDIILQDTTGSVEPYKPRLVTLLKLLFWTQNELERKKIQFPKMTDLVNGTIVDSRY